MRLEAYTLLGLWWLGGLLVAGRLTAAEEVPASALTPRPTVGAEPTPTPEGTPEAGAALRDPFRPFNLSLRPRLVETPKTPLEQYDVGALKLVAVIFDTQNPKAMVEDDTGLGYTVEIGTKIGNNGGVVKTIDPDRLVVEEDFVDFYGEKKKTEIVLRLKPEGEKRP